MAPAVSLTMLGHAGVAVAGLGVGRPLDGGARLQGPGVGGGRHQVLGEVLGGAGAVGAVGHHDVGGREVGAGVEGLDGGVVPLGDLALEDLGDGVGVEDEVVDVEVVGDGDGRGHGREVEELALVLGLVLVLHQAVAAGEVDHAVLQVLAAGARPAAGVLDGDAGLLRPGRPRWPPRRSPWGTSPPSPSGWPVSWTPPVVSVPPSPVSVLVVGPAGGGPHGQDDGQGRQLHDPRLVALHQQSSSLEVIRRPRRLGRGVVRRLAGR